MKQQEIIKSAELPHFKIRFLKDVAVFCPFNYRALCSINASKMRYHRFNDGVFGYFWKMESL